MSARACFLVVLVLSVAVGGCAQAPTREQTGMVIGGILGGYLAKDIGKSEGEEAAATIIGTLLGAALGGAIGRSMDEVDRLKTGSTLETVRTGVSSTWRNPDTGTHYTVTPTRTFETASGPCRDFTVEAMIEGRTETVYGTACRQPDGTWRMQG